MVVHYEDIHQTRMWIEQRRRSVKLSIKNPPLPSR